VCSPSEDLDRDHCPRDVTAVRLPLMRFASSSESCKLPAGGTIGFPTPASFSSFPTETAVFTGGRYPHALRKKGSSSRELRASSEFSCPFLPCTVRCKAPPLGLPSLFATSAASACDGFPDHRVPSAPFLTTSTAPLVRRFASLFHPAATSRVSLRGSRPRGDRNLVGCGLPSRRWLWFAASRNWRRCAIASSSGSSLRVPVARFGKWHLTT
jgi:hypothetical protein